MRGKARTSDTERRLRVLEEQNQQLRNAPGGRASPRCGQAGARRASGRALYPHVPPRGPPRSASLHGDSFSDRPSNRPSHQQPGLQPERGPALRFEPRDRLPSEASAGSGADSGCDTRSPMTPRRLSSDDLPDSLVAGASSGSESQLRRSPSRRSGVHQRRLKGTAAVESLPASGRSFEGFLQQLEALKHSGVVSGDATATATVTPIPLSAPGPAAGVLLRRTSQTFATSSPAMAHSACVRSSSDTGGDTGPRHLRRLSDGELILESTAELLAHSDGMPSPALAGPSPVPAVPLGRAASALSTGPIPTSPVPGTIPDTALALEEHGAPNDDCDAGPLMPSSKRPSRRRSASMFRSLFRSVSTRRSSSASVLI